MKILKYITALLLFTLGVHAQVAVKVDGNGVLLSPLNFFSANGVAAGSTALLKANNLSDITSPSTARANLALTIGVHVQAYSANLDTFASNGPAYYLNWTHFTNTPTTISGYGITDPLVYTSGTYSNPSWITALAWGKITGTPTSVAGYGVTNGSTLDTIAAAGPLGTGAYVTLGTGIATALGVNVGSAGAPVIFNGAGGTPSSMTGTNISGTAASFTVGAATNIATTSTSSNASFYPLMVASSSNSNQGASLSSTWTFNPSTGIMSGLSAPSATGDAATKGYVDSQLQDFEIKDPTVAATTGVLPFSPSYSNGSSGVGATLTGSFGVLTIDGYTPVLGDRILVKNQSSSLQNGIYTVTTVGAIGTGYVLTRAADFNQTANIIYGDTTNVLQGSTNANQQFSMSNQNSITVGTTVITFSQTSGGSQLVQGTGITITGNTVALSVPVTAANGGMGTTSVPSAGQVAVGNAGGTAYAPTTISNDATLASTGALTLTNGNSTRTNLGVYPIGTTANSALDSGTWLTMNGQVVSQSTYATLFGIVGHQPEFNWQYTPLLGATSTINHACYGNGGTYVAVGNNGVIYTSTNLTSWTSRTSGVATTLNAVSWDSTNSLFIAVGASNVILTSPDGATWTSRTSGVTSSLQNIVVANGEDVAGGSAGWVSYSTNGTSWTATQPNSAPTIQRIIYANSVWFCPPNGNSTNGFVYSTDGTSWNYVAKPTTSGFQFLGYDSTYFYGEDVSGAAPGEIWKTTSGASWTDTGNQIPDTPPSVNCSFPATNLIEVGGLIPLYTNDGFATLHPIINPGILGITPSNSSSCIVSPNDETNVKFGIYSGSSVGSSIPVYTADGIHFSTDYKSTLGFPNTPFLRRYCNGYIVLNNNTTSSRLLYALQPYNPSTQFQIPTRYNGAGNNLVIKALN